MRLSFLLIPLVALGSAAFAQTEPPAPQSERARVWWATVSTLSADSMQGREAGSEGHRRASELLKKSGKQIERPNFDRRR